MEATGGCGKQKREDVAFLPPLLLLFFTLFPTTQSCFLLAHAQVPSDRCSTCEPAPVERGLESWAISQATTCWAGADWGGRPRRGEPDLLHEKVLDGVVTDAMSPGLLTYPQPPVPSHW